MEKQKKPLLGMTLSGLKEVAAETGLPAFSGKQMAEWLYRHHVRDISEMTNLSKSGRELLSEAYEVGAMPPLTCQRSQDGTVKYLFPTASGQRVETVYIPDGDRATLCVSCQVGCKMGCKFCQTGRQGFEGHLTARDIINQVYSLPERDRLTNIVFMGQGEPMDNLDPVLQAIEVLTAPYGYAWSPECHVAISLHAPTPEIRLQLMPAEHGMPIEEVLTLLRQYDFAHQRRLSFEYIVFKGVNDSLAHGRALVRLLKGLDCRINLIRFHAIPDCPLEGVDDRQMEALRDYLTQHGVFTTIRASRGQDIYAACGLLSTAERIADERK